MSIPVFGAGALLAALPHPALQWQAMEPDRSPLLTCRQLVVGYSGIAMLPAIDMQVRPRELWAVIGPNGSGKSTVLRTILGLLAPIGGELTRTDTGIGYVPQRNDIDPAVPARVIDLVRAGVDRGWSFLSPLWVATRSQAVAEALADTQTRELASEPWTHLSEGQKQRVLMAQALAGNPQLLVLDEPTSAMDVHAERSVFALLDELRQRRSLGVVVVGHNLSILARYATHALFVDKDEAQVASGDVADVVRSDAFVERFGAGVAQHLRAQRSGDAG